MEGLGVNPDFWRGRRVFVTGHTGFKGSWLCLWLTKLGAEVTGYALPPATEPNLFTLLGLAQTMNSIISDVTDRAALEKAIMTARPEIVFHMAAQALVLRSYDDPVATYATNIMGTVHLLDSLRRAPNLRAVVNVTSDKCYENREWPWGYRENEAMGGYDPYSSSKGCAELVTAAYRNSFFPADRHADHGVAVASGRAGNVIGGGDWSPNRLIPDILHAFSTNTAAQIRNPHAIRPWQHVLEPLRGYLTLAKRLANDGADFAQGWNFGPAESDAKPVEWIVQRLATNWGDGARWDVQGGMHKHEAHYLKLDCSKAAAELDWRPRWNLDTALEKIVDWHRAWLARQDLREVSLDQIAAYEGA